MKVTIARFAYFEDRTLGIMNIGGTQFATLEPVKESIEKPRCIPMGAYQAETFISKKAKGKTFKLKNVPDFSDILIHIGNRPEDTRGCILIGMAFSQLPEGVRIIQSADAMELFQKITESEDEIDIEIREIL